MTKAKAKAKAAAAKPDDAKPDDAKATKAQASKVWKCSGCGAEYPSAGTCTGNPKLETGHEPIELEKADATDGGAEVTEDAAA